MAAGAIATAAKVALPYIIDYGLPFLMSALQGGAERAARARIAGEREALAGGRTDESPTAQAQRQLQTQQQIAAAVAPMMAQIARGSASGAMSGPQALAAQAAMKTALSGQQQAASASRQASLDRAAMRRQQLNQMEMGLIGVEQGRKQAGADVLLDMAKSGFGAEAAGAGQAERSSIGQQLSSALLKGQGAG
tara:strand:+ start:31414 stop:31992 length:579 start_codon:yes stop_codon:yes gene_type:complete